MHGMSDPYSANYSRVWFTFMRNALVREMTFRGNFLINLVTRGFWFFAQITLFEIIYRNVPSIGCISSSKAGAGFCRPARSAVSTTLGASRGSHRLTLCV